jgi:hypothetical protein
MQQAVPFDADSVKNTAKSGGSGGGAFTQKQLNLNGELK